MPRFRGEGAILYLSDVDAAYIRALEAGARSLEEPQDTHYGERRAMVEDPCRNIWQIATHIEDVSPEEIRRRLDAPVNLRHRKNLHVPKIS
jgi:hypothetical protein